MLPFSHNGGPTTGRARRTDGSLAAGISLSAALHVLAFMALLMMSARQGGDAQTVIRPEPGVTSVYLTAPFLRQSASVSPQNESLVHAETPAPAASHQALGAIRASAIAAPVADSARPSNSVGSPAALAQAEPAPVADPALGEEYRKRLQAHIAGYRRAPGRPAGGLVQVQLAIGRDGNVIAVAVAASSGDAELDEEAVATIWRARPMPPIPQALPPRLLVTLPISFDPRRLAAGAGSWR